MGQVLAVAGVLLGLGAPTAVPQDSARGPAGRTAFVDTYCLPCHGPLKQKADFRIDQLSADLSSAEPRERWAQVLEYVEEGEMPPRKAERHPAPDEMARFVAALRNDMDAAQNEAPVGGPVLRRMNRDEHLNTLHDLFGIRGLRLPGTFPEDASEFQFDTISAGLYSSAAHLDACLLVATEVADRVVPLGVVEQVDLEALHSQWGTGLPHWKKRDETAFYFTGVNNSAWSGGLWNNAFVAPEPGIYSVRLRANAEAEAGIDGRPLRIGFYAIEPALYGRPERVRREGLARVGELEVTNLTPGELHCEVELERGEAFYMFCENRIRQNDPAHGLDRVELSDVVTSARKQPQPTIRVESLGITGPVRLLPRQQALLGDDFPTWDESSVRAALLPLAERAFRRPLTDDEQAAIITRAVEHGATAPSLAHGVHYGIRRILTSPQFLYLDTGTRATDDYGLASRLSYFLWSTQPDAELLASAREGRLSDPDVLRAQVSRMTADPRAQHFVQNFTGQWLSNREAASVMVCDQRHDWTEALRYGFLRSTEMFFDEILQRNLSIRAFIDSDFTYANVAMRSAWGLADDGPSWARHDARYSHSYVWPEPSRLDLTSLAPDAPVSARERGGILGLSGVLMATGDGVQSSPILRGVWILENLFGTPSPPPPDDVPAFVPDISQARTVRELLAAHQESESCARCHVKIDPLGLAMENYDAIGSWRSEYMPVVAEGLRTDGLTPFSVNASSTMENGTPLNGPGDIKAYLLTKPELFSTCLATKLLEYGTGHEPTAGDLRVVQEIVAAEPDGGYGFRDLIVAIVQSESFHAR